jgi:acyl-CoA synthetase (AMP-forming)/AMP-acid ligase II
MRESVTFRATFADEEPGFRSALWKTGVPGPGESYEPLHATLVVALEKAQTNGRRIGVTLLPDKDKDGGAPEHWSWAKIAAEARVLAKVLRARGVERGEPVLLVFHTSFEFIVSFFALILLGAIPVPSYPPALFEKLELAIGRLSHIASAAGIRTCLTNALFFPLLGELARTTPSLRDIVAVERLLGDAQARNGSDAIDADVRPDDVCFLQYTSGSTDRPKGVVLTHKNVCSNVHAIAQGARIHRRDVIVSWLPLYHDMGLIGAVITSMFLSVPLVLMSPHAFLEKPVRWLRAITKYKGTLSTAPNFGYALCVKRIREKDRQGLDLSSWRLALNGAEPVHHRTLVEFTRQFEQYGFDPKAVLPVYGLAETALAATFPEPGSEIRYQVVDRNELANGHVVPRRGQGTLAIVSVGRPMPGHRIYVVDAAGKAVPEGQVGHVVLSGPSVMRGYWRDEEATRAVLRRGMLWTGDLGFEKDGDLYVTGRAKDLIIHRGRNYYAEDIERVVERVAGVRAGGVAAFSISDEEKEREIIVVVCEAKPSSDEPTEDAELIERVSAVISEQVGLVVDEIVVVPPGTVPRTSSGKRQRGLTRQLYLSGELLKPNRTGKLKAALIFVRSRIGLWSLASRRMREGQRSKER